MDLRNKTTSEFRTLFLSPLGVPNCQVSLYMYMLISKTPNRCGTSHRVLWLEPTLIQRLNIFIFMDSFSRMLSIPPTSRWSYRYLKRSCLVIQKTCEGGEGGRQQWVKPFQWSLWMRYICQIFCTWNQYICVLDHESVQIYNACNLIIFLKALLGNHFQPFLTPSGCFSSPRSFITWRKNTRYMYA